MNLSSPLTVFITANSNSFKIAQKTAFSFQFIMMMERYSKHIPSTI